MRVRLCEALYCSILGWQQKEGIDRQTDRGGSGWRSGRMDGSMSVQKAVSCFNQQTPACFLLSFAVLWSWDRRFVFGGLSFNSHPNTTRKASLKAASVTCSLAGASVVMFLIMFKCCMWPRDMSPAAHRVSHLCPAGWIPSFYWSTAAPRPGLRIHMVQPSGP